MPNEKWVRVEAGGEPAYGLVEGDSISLVQGSLFGKWQRSGKTLPLATTILLPPVIPPTFYACGINYAEHAHAAARKHNKPLESLWPKTPEVGYRAQSAITRPGAQIIIPADAAENTQAEGELAVVIGRTAKHVSEADAMNYVFGYTICNDVSQRDWQYADRTFWRSKNSDTFKPLGPWIVTGVDLDKLHTRVLINGKVGAEFKTNNMIYSIATYIAVMTRYITLVPGDIIIMGTDGEAPRIAAGDTVSVEIAGIGTLTNKVVREGA
jgi:2-keto-4-pentenoate hydratase/2-oxohepta-3-ene-1,7-dioic acid hydratase in catechol pathway